MKNITLKIDDAVHRKARVKAAEQGTSLSAVTRQFLIAFAEGKSLITDQQKPRSAKFKELWASIDAMPAPQPENSERATSFHDRAGLETRPPYSYSASYQFVCRASYSEKFSVGR